MHLVNLPGDLGNGRISFVHERARFYLTRSKVASSDAWVESSCHIVPNMKHLVTDYILIWTKKCHLLMFTEKCGNLSPVLI